MQELRVNRPEVYTTEQIASAYQVSKRWVEILCKKYGIRRHGKSYLIDILDAQRLAKELYKRAEDTSIFDEYRGEE